MDLRLKGYLIALMVGFLMSAGQLLFKAGSNDIHYDNIYSLAKSILSSPAVLAAIMLYALTILLWIFALKLLPLSIAYSITAIAFIVTPIFAHTIFQESYSANTLIGSLLIATGIITINAKVIS